MHNCLSSIYVSRLDRESQSQEFLVQILLLAPLLELSHCGNLAFDQSWTLAQIKWHPDQLSKSLINLLPSFILSVACHLKFETGALQLELWPASKDHIDIGLVLDLTRLDPLNDAPRVERLRSLTVQHWDFHTERRLSDDDIVPPLWVSAALMQIAHVEMTVKLGCCDRVSST